MYVYMDYSYVDIHTHIRKHSMNMLSVVIQLISVHVFIHVINIYYTLTVCLAPV